MILFASPGARPSRVALFSLLLAVVAVPAFATSSGKRSHQGAGSSPATITSYSGSALAFRVDGVENPISGSIIVADTGPLPAAGGVIEKHDADVSIAGGALTIATADARVSGLGAQTLAETQLTNFRVHFIAHDGHDVIIEGDYIGVSASATVNGGGKVSTAGNVVIQGLTVNGEPVTVTGSANQVVEVHGSEVKFILNHRVSAGGKGSGDIAVAAIKFEICDCMSGYFGLVSAGISAGSRPPPEESGECGKLTGGGWIVGTPSGGKGSFGVSGGIRRGAFWGHLAYVDHGAKLKVKSTSVTGFETEPGNANARIIRYNVTINGAPGTAAVRVVDNGEPGRNDVFSITLSNGYTAGGDLGGSRKGGGNIQLHKCPRGWE